VAKKEFTDGCVPSTWSIDLHYPKLQYAKKFQDNPFISIAEHDRRIDRDFGYPVPYRCFYSRNIENMFMAGRCISVTHEALGTVRVMKTCGMMGEVVGKAASICISNNCPPAAVYERYWPEMDKLLQLPGKAHRSKLTDTMTIPSDSMTLAGPLGLPTGVDPASLSGLVIDNRQATTTGDWVSGTGLKGYVGYDYVYASPKSNSTITFEFTPDRELKVEIRLAYQPHENRASNALVSVSISGVKTQLSVDMRKPPTLSDTFVSLGEFDISNSQPVVVQISTDGANGNVHADAVQFLPVE